MHWRRRQVEIQPPDQTRWTMLPPQFYHNLVDGCNKNAVSHANGKLNPFPAFWEVDYVYFPVLLEGQDWMLFRVDLRSLQLLFYYSHDLTSDDYRRVVRPTLIKINVYFTTLLVNIRYWKKTGKVESLLLYECNEEYIQRYQDLIGNEGVYVCMLMEHLVTGKPVDRLMPNFGQACKTYRRFMADQFYFWRCLPRPVVS
jgi:hypothetical protein